ncbi:hypothetical protein J6590_043530 [Homalodisca vitripennis]|nr:hypothetical protein J6590_043530 [Homalodisca vitripennis]
MKREKITKSDFFDQAPRDAKCLNADARTMWMISATEAAWSALVAALSSKSSKQIELLRSPSGILPQACAFAALRQRYKFICRFPTIRLPFFNAISSELLEQQAFVDINNCVQFFHSLILTTNSSKTKVLNFALRTAGNQCEPAIFLADTTLQKIVSLILPESGTDYRAFILKKAIRIIAKIKFRELCREYFKKLQLLILPSFYIIETCTCRAIKLQEMRYAPLLITGRYRRSQPQKQPGHMHMSSDRQLACGPTFVSYRGLSWCRGNMALFNICRPIRPRPRRAIQSALNSDLALVIIIVMEAGEVRAKKPSIRRLPNHHQWPGSSHVRRYLIWLSCITVVPTKLCLRHWWLRFHSKSSSSHFLENPKTAYTTRRRSQTRLSLKAKYYTRVVSLNFHISMQISTQLTKAGLIHDRWPTLACTHHNTSLFIKALPPPDPRTDIPRGCAPLTHCLSHLLSCLCLTLSDDLPAQV